MEVLAAFMGNLAVNGSIVKTAGIDPALFTFSGPAIIFESQEEAVEGILNGMVKEGNAVIRRFEGPKGGPGMQEMLYPTSYLKSKGLDRRCALVTDGRFSGRHVRSVCRTCITGGCGRRITGSGAKWRYN